MARSRAHAKATQPPVEPPPPEAPGTPTSRAWSIAGFTAMGALALTLVVRLAGQAAKARLYTDECFHAYAAEWIARHGRLPVDFPEIYSGFFFYYPPLLHLLGAAWIAILGTGSLLQLNVVLFALLIVVAASPLVPGLPAAPRRWSVLIILATHWLVLYSVRFYVEILITLLCFTGVLLLVRFHRTGRMRDAAWLGVVTGLALVAKQTGVAMGAVLAVFTVWSLLARDRGRLPGFGVACGIAIAISAPYFIRNAMLYGSPVYPMLAPITENHLWQLKLKGVAPPASPHFYREIQRAIGPVVATMTVAAILAAAWRRRGKVIAGIAWAALVVIATQRATTLFDVRHTMPFIALLALAGSLLVWDAVARWPRAVAAVELVLLVVAGHAVFTLGQLRGGLDVPPRLQTAYTAARERVPEGASILSVWTYDTFYYTRRPAMWPNEWSSQPQPYELFYEHDPDRFLALLQKYRIDYMLLPRFKTPPVWNGVNYPSYFMDCIETLGLRGSLKLVWESDNLALVGVRKGGVATPAP